MTAIQTIDQDAKTFAHKYMTVKQAKFLFSLINERVPAAELEAWKTVYRTVSTRAELDRAYTALKSMPKIVKVAPVSAPVPHADEPGMYRDPATATIYRVRPGKLGLKAQRLNQIGGQRLDLNGNVVKLEWVFANLRSVQKDWKVSLEELADFGIQYGICANCWAPLKDATSVKLGIGPVCRKNLGL